MLCVKINPHKIKLSPCRDVDSGNRVVIVATKEQLI